MPNLLRPDTWTLDYFEALVKVASLICGLVSFVVVGVIQAFGDHEFKRVWAGALAGAGIPTGLAVITCAFEKSLLPALADLSLYLGITGASLVYLSFDAIVDSVRRQKPVSDPNAGKPATQGDKAPNTVR